MERRNAQVFDVEEATDLEESGPVDVSAPTVVVSAAPLPACMRNNAPTVRHIPVARLPGKPMRGPVRHAQPQAHPQAWMSGPVETAPVGPIPMPGERRSAEALTIVLPKPKPEPVQRPLAMRAAEPPVQYSVERALAAPRVPQPSPRDDRRRNTLVALIGMLAGFVIVLGCVVIRQQRELRVINAPAQRLGEACATYAAEVRAIALELTQTAAAVADVESRIGERARSVVGERGLLRLCTGADAPRCAQGDAACVASAVMQLRQALSR